MSLAIGVGVWFVLGIISWHWAEIMAQNAGGPQTKAKFVWMVALGPILLLCALLYVVLNSVTKKKK